MHSQVPSLLRFFATTAVVGVCVASMTAAAVAGPREGPRFGVAAAASCTDVIFIGARGSGEAAEKKTKGMGPSVYKMYERMRGLIVADGMTVRAGKVVYDALGVETLAPSPRQVGMLGGPLAPAGLALWYKNNYRKYMRSVSEGTTATEALVKTLAARCPDTDLILGGYSQGAMAVHQAELNLRDEGSIDALDAIAGTILLGDGDRVSQSSAHLVGTSPPEKEGVRTYAHTIEPRDVADPELTVNICDANDPVCDFDPSRLLNFPRFKRVHTEYLKRNGGERLKAAVDWLYNESLSP